MIQALLREARRTAGFYRLAPAAQARRQAIALLRAKQYVLRRGIAIAPQRELIPLLGGAQ